MILSTQKNEDNVITNQNKSLERIAPSLLQQKISGLSGLSGLRSTSSRFQLSSSNTFPNQKFSLEKSTTDVKTIDQKNEANFQNINFLRKKVQLLSCEISSIKLQNSEQKKLWLKQQTQKEIKLKEKDQLINRLQKQKQEKISQQLQIEELKCLQIQSIVKQLSLYFGSQMSIQQHLQLSLTQQIFQEQIEISVIRDQTQINSVASQLNIQKMNKIFKVYYEQHIKKLLQRISKLKQKNQDLQSRNENLQDQNLQKESQLSNYKIQIDEMSTKIKYNQVQLEIRIKEAKEAITNLQIRLGLEKKEIQKKFVEFMLEGEIERIVAFAMGFINQNSLPEQQRQIINEKVEKLSTQISKCKQIIKIMERN